MIDHGSRVKLSDKNFVNLIDNKCLSELKHERQVMTSNGIQTISESYFLLIDNIGPDVDEIIVAPRGASTPMARLRDIRKGVSLAMCVGYQGKSGGASRSDAPDHITAKRGHTTTEIPVPDRALYSGIGVSDCGPIYFGYPDPPN
jgi:hypothetical protein